MTMIYMLPVLLTLQAKASIMKKDNPSFKVKY